ncbi:hypothetical protein Bbelb_059560 [Branchiostoma belcheri]|nr:hypothetical protein Bbelb_059560 [Branchiostoma belcheri]
MGISECIFPLQGPGHDDKTCFRQTQGTRDQNLSQSGVTDCNVTLCVTPATKRAKMVENAGNIARSAQEFIWFAGTVISCCFGLSSDLQSPNVAALPRSLRRNHRGSEKKRKAVGMKVILCNSLIKHLMPGDLEEESAPVSRLIAAKTST